MNADEWDELLKGVNSSESLRNEINASSGVKRDIDIVIALIDMNRSSYAIGEETHESMHFCPNEDDCDICEEIAHSMIIISNHENDEVIANIALCDMHRSYLINSLNRT